MTVSVALKCVNVVVLCSIDQIKSDSNNKEDLDKKIKKTSTLTEALIHLVFTNLTRIHHVH